ncbi:MAG: hypothetical protein GQ477_01815 [Nanohaloarchaea archaeon]|nr:hypothetical protein [Candidatus Nanohaloarchaea archaeon]
MSNLRFSVPYNNNYSLLNKLSEIKDLSRNKIEEVYLAGPQEYFGSGRVTPKYELVDFIDVIKFCHENGLKVNLLLNSQCEGLEWYNPQNVSRIINYVKDLHNNHELDTVTIANPLFIQKIRKELPKIKICASVLSYVNSVQRAMFFDKFGVDEIIPDRDINRDLELLIQIKESVNAKLKLMVNEGCLYECPYKLFHDNWISHASKEGIRIDPALKNCGAIFKIDNSQLLKSSWIMPEDMKKYRKITECFKLVGRDKSNEFILTSAKAYLSETSTTNLMDIINGTPQFFVDSMMLTKSNFFETVTSCNQNCFKCNYCEFLAKQIQTL